MKSKFLPTALVAILLGWTVPSLAQSPEPVPYCRELKELNNYAMSQRRFAPIIGMPKEGNYRTTSLPLTGWINCAFYGTTSYTCDSTELKSHEEAARAQQRIAQEILDCFAGTWAEAPEQMGPDFMVLHPKLGPAAWIILLDRTFRTSVCIVDDTGRIVREVKVASEPDALLPVLTKPCPCRKLKPECIDGADHQNGQLEHVAYSVDVTRDWGVLLERQVGPDVIVIFLI